MPRIRPSVRTFLSAKAELLPDILAHKLNIKNEKKSNPVRKSPCVATRRVYKDRIIFVLSNGVK
ncbi:hypothetical protein A3A21_01655 [Candidatus Jorgensenbacteria bacterium RIFCSPLOWO2_01_FULL_45_25b]|uniref:Uncharacterized protein n=1 Tax=Candidatus Jorgensenbacteria bacterium RIFCSPLOWO2_01_FULL_45_25b TaxID=1798471 RepID=A0A1F6BTE2_9BACT|nr:MAG: hypothetical protein A3A21_01655 [Candidatus Jorgensenbacteria bacterium RIFCSPLOWO2_01_FULL_45_25b]